MIARYTRPEMGRIWSDENRFQKWLDVEIAVCEVLAERGEIPSEAVEKIRRKASFSVERTREIESRIHHDVVAFTTAVGEQVGPESLTPKIRCSCQSWKLGLSSHEGHGLPALSLW